MPQLLVCDAVTNGQCDSPRYIEVDESALVYLEKYSGFVEEYYWIGFESVLSLFVVGLTIGLIINQVRKLR